MQCFVAGLYRLSVDQYHRHHASLATTVDPVVDGTALHHDIPLLEVNLFSTFKLHVNLARHHHDVVNAVSAMHALLNSRVEVQNTEHAAAVDHGELARALAVVVLQRVVGRCRVGRPDVADLAVWPPFFEMGTDFVNLDYGFAIAVMACDDASDSGCFHDVWRGYVLFSFDLGVFDNAAPFGHLGLDVAGEFV